MSLCCSGVAPVPSAVPCRVVVVALLATRQGSAAHGPLDEESTRNWSKYGIGLLAYLAVLILTRVKEGGKAPLLLPRWPPLLHSLPLCGGVGCFVCVNRAAKLVRNAVGLQFGHFIGRDWVDWQNAKAH